MSADRILGGKPPNARRSAPPGCCQVLFLLHDSFTYGAYDQRMRRTVGCVAVIALALLTGCARARITTEIHPDGSWSRAVLLAAPAKKEGGMQMTPSLEETFVVPTGEGWKVSEGKQQNDATKTFERVVAAPGSLK